MAAVLKTWDAVKAEVDNRPTQVVLLLLGNGDGFDEIVGYAYGAVNFPEIEAVIWFPNAPQGMSPAEVQRYKPGDPKYVACALSVPKDGTRLVCAYVPRDAADPLVFMKALDAAAKFTQPPVVPE